MHDLSTRLLCGNVLSLTSKAALCLLLIFVAESLVRAEDIQVGGDAGWTETAVIKDLNAVIGDRLVFEWEGEERNVVTLPKNSCSNAESGVEIAAASASPAVVSLNYTGTFFFSTNFDEQCSSGLLFAVAVTPQNETSEDVKKDHEEDREQSFEDLIRHGEGRCLDPTMDASDAGLVSVVCHSPPMRLQPGQVEDALYYLPNPFPEGKLVGVTKQSLGIVDDTNRPVPLSELYLHHIFGPSDLVNGEGAEFRGSLANPPLPPPYYTVINGSHFTSEASRLVNIHVINTLGVAPEEVPRCIECWCTDKEHQLRGKHGGGSCCFNCSSSLPATALTTYHLQFNITYRLLEPDTPVVPVTSYMLDAANGSIEYDVVKQAGQQATALSASGPLDSRCPQSSAFGILRCLGHQHIGGQCMRLLDQDTGEELCSSCPTYGAAAARDAVGDEPGYLVGMSQTAMEQPRLIQPGTNVTIESVYDPTQNHFGVMSLFFLDLVGFNTSCPGPVTATTGAAFGPDYAHHEGTAFGFYASGFVPESSQELQAEPGDTLGIDHTADPGLPTNAAAVAMASKMMFSTVTLVGSLVVFAAAGTLAWRLSRSRTHKYERLKQGDLSEDIINSSRSHRLSSVSEA